MPTLGEIAAINQATFAGIEKNPFKIASDIVGLQQSQQNLAKSRYDFAQQQQNDALDILTGTWQNPVWDNGTPEQAIGLINQTREQLKSRGIPISRGGILDQIEGQIAQGILDQDPNSMVSARNMMRDAVNQFGGNRANYAQSTYDNQTGKVIRRDVGGRTVIDTATQRPSVPPSTTPSGAIPSAGAGYNFNLAYPNARPNQFATEPNEEPERQYGLGVRANAVSSQVRSQENILALDKAFSTINDIDKDRILQTGKLADIQRFYNEKLKGDPRYKELSKQLADLELRDAEQAGGGAVNTVAGLDLRRVASGDETFPPKVLQEIIYRRAGRELENKARSDAVVKFAGVHGDQNIRSFLTEWSKYNDPLVFQVEYILKSNLNPAEKQVQINRILENVPAEQKQALKEKRRKIKELGG